MRRFGPLHLTTGQSLDVQTLRSMGSLRTAVLPLREDVDPEVDRQRFEALCRSADVVVRLYGEADRLRGFGVGRVRRVATPRRVALILPEYFVLEPSLRGHPLGMLLQICGVFGLHRLIGSAPIYVGGVGYPTAILGAAVTADRVHLWGEAMPIEAARVLEAILADPHVPDLIPGTDRCRLPTRPRVSPRWLERVSDDPLYLRSLARAPNWMEGFGLPFVVAFRRRNLVYALARAVRRLE